MEDNVSVRKLRRAVAAICTCALAAGPHAARAGETSVERQPSALSASGPGWIITVGGWATYSPDFAGAKKNSWGGLPSISWRREGEKAEFSAPDDGMDYAIIDTPRFKFGPVAGLSDGRSASDDPRLRGLSNYPTGLQAGIFADFWPVQDLLRMRAELRHGFRSADGFVLDAGVDLVREIGRFTFSAGPRVTFADTDQMQLEFGVSQADAQRTGLQQFKPEAGPESVGGIVAVSYAWTPDVTFTVYDRLDHLAGDAADSPITRNFGSLNQNTFGVGLTYSFHTGCW